MNVTPDEAGEALAAIEKMVRKTKKSISSSGAYVFLIIWGFIWFFGFLSSHFFPGEPSNKVWIILDIVGGILSIVVGFRLNRNIRSPSASLSGSRIGLFWFLLFAYCFAAISIVWPVDGKTAAMIIILFVTVGWIAMGLLLSTASVWWGLALTALALFGYFLLPDIFYIWMGILGGGGMIALGIYIRNRW